MFVFHFFSYFKDLFLKSDFYHYEEFFFVHPLVSIKKINTYGGSIHFWKKNIRYQRNELEGYGFIEYVI